MNDAVVKEIISCNLFKTIDVNTSIVNIKVYKNKTINILTILIGFNKDSVKII